MRVLSVVAAMAAVTPQTMGDSIYVGLSDYEEFRTYPYVDKAYRLQQEERYQAALVELEHAIEIAPEHEPFTSMPRIGDVKSRHRTCASLSG